MRTIGKRFVTSLLCAAPLLTGCLLPNTYFDPEDPYAIGLRAFDRGHYDLAAYHWSPLVEQGDCDAQYRVGLLYTMGKGKPRDCKRALALWKKAAEGNHPLAQMALGDLRYGAEGLAHENVACEKERDLVQALVWYLLAQRSARYKGEKNYTASVIERITAEMSAGQVAKAESIVEQWKPTPWDCEPRHWW